MKHTKTFVSIILTAAVLLTGCSGLTLGLNTLSGVTNVPSAAATVAANLASNPAAVTATPVTAFPAQPETLSGFQSALTQVYERVNPGVVNLRVIQKVTRNETLNIPDIPGFPSLPGFDESQGNSAETPVQEGAGSGFVWDKKGHIVTNNHVVQGADKVTVTFADGYGVEGEVVGTDPDSDLAVVKVDMPADQLFPIEIADSTQAKVGQIAIAIGNPYGLEGTMTFGIISGLGRSLPVDSEENSGPYYSIPDIIQTDAPINPGNSGGVLTDVNGNVLGVTTAIESTTRSNAGIGFVVPSAIIKKVVPALIKDGNYNHTWLGISGMTLNSELTKAMDLKADQRGVLVLEVTPSSPADKAGISGSDRQINIDGQKVLIGGDILTAVDGQPIKEFDDLVTYLARSTEIGQKIALKVLRDGNEKEYTVTLAARPGVDNPLPQADAEEKTSGNEVWMGISGLSMTPALAKTMDLSDGQKGVLVQQVEQNSPADKAGLHGSFKPFTLDGERVLVGGDVITALDGKPINSMDELKSALKGFKAGDEASLTVLRESAEVSVKVKLEQKPG